MNTFKRLPFSYDVTQSFFDKLSEWIGDLFYDVFPEAGLELRDEQIFMAFQLEQAFKEKKVMFAEAGVGTGKTIAYLLYAICYARYMRKPVIISCADESLIEQLVKKEGDIAKLEKILKIDIDARLAKSKDQYVCLQKLDEERSRDEYDEVFDDVYDALPDFVFLNETMQSFYHYGDRTEYPALTNEQWEKINWDPFQDCFVCDKRHRCGQTLSREHYRKSTDLIICSHDFYMEHVWTIEARKREGQLPLLPEAAAVIFDEGHLLEVAAQKALTYRLRHDILEDILTRLLQNDVREEFAMLIETLLAESVVLHDMLKDHAKAVIGSSRYIINHSEQLMHQFQTFLSLIQQLEDEIVFESEMYTIDEYELKIVEEHLDMIGHALSLFVGQENVIAWVEKNDDETTLVIMPKLVEEVLQERVFSKKIPFIFSSATLSTDDSFDYIAKSVGISDFLSFSVPSPFDYEKNMQVFAPVLQKEKTFSEKVFYAKEMMKKTDGKTLVLFNNFEELKAFRHAIENDEEMKKWPIMFEGDREITQLISSFQRDVNACLCAISLWEGLDIPGEALKQVIIWSLPFPPEDPVFLAKRKGSRNPYEEIDLPYMLLRFRQGIGRLIRTRSDSGFVTILDEKLHIDKTLYEKIERVIPDGVQIYKNINEMGK